MSDGADLVRRSGLRGRGRAARAAAVLRYCGTAVLRYGLR